MLENLVIASNLRLRNSGFTSIHHARFSSSWRVRRGEYDEFDPARQMISGGPAYRAALKN
jgi:hypothetical protein